MRRSTGLRMVAVAGVMALGVTACGSGSSGSKANDRQPGREGRGPRVRSRQRRQGPGVRRPRQHTRAASSSSSSRPTSPTWIPRASTSTTTSRSPSWSSASSRRTSRRTARSRWSATSRPTPASPRTVARAGPTRCATTCSFDDGNPVKPSDIKYAVERGFDSAYTEGPTYLYDWLAGKAGELPQLLPRPVRRASPCRTRSSRRTTPPKTITFFFDQPRADMPFAAGLTTTSPVQKAKDTKAKYDLMPQSTGPYKISEHTVDKSLTLVKNTDVGPEERPGPPPVRRRLRVHLRCGPAGDQPAPDRRQR